VRACCADQFLRNLTLISTGALADFLVSLWRDGFNEQTKFKNSIQWTPTITNTEIMPNYKVLTHKRNECGVCLHLTRLFNNKYYYNHHCHCRRRRRRCCNCNNNNSGTQLRTIQ
jgi:hypothetical protein